MEVKLGNRIDFQVLHPEFVNSLVKVRRANILPTAVIPKSFVKTFTAWHITLSFFSRKSRNIFPCPQIFFALRRDLLDLGMGPFPCREKISNAMQMIFTALFACESVSLFGFEYGFDVKDFAASISTERPSITTLVRLPVAMARTNRKLSLRLSLCFVSDVG